MRFCQLTSTKFETFSVFAGLRVALSIHRVVSISFPSQARRDLRSAPKRGSLLADHAAGGLLVDDGGLPALRVKAVVGGAAGGEGLPGQAVVGVISPTGGLTVGVGDACGVSGGVVAIRGGPF
jgi:hypothetical protein